MTLPASQVYVLRVWYEPSLEGEVWRASVSQGDERHYFAAPQDLAAFLQSQFPHALPGDADEKRP